MTETNQVCHRARELLKLGVERLGHTVIGQKSQTPQRWVEDKRQRSRQTAAYHGDKAQA